MSGGALVVSLLGILLGNFVYFPRWPFCYIEARFFWGYARLWIGERGGWMVNFISLKRYSKLRWIKKAGVNIVICFASLLGTCVY